MNCRFRTPFLGLLTAVLFHTFSPPTSAQERDQKPDLIGDIRVDGVVFTKDSSRLVTGSHDMTAVIWDIKTGKKVQTFAGHKSFVNGVAISANAEFVLTASSDHTAKLWDGKTGKELQAFKHESVVSSAALSDDGALAMTGSWDETAALWDTKTGAKLHALTDHKHFVVSVAISADGKLALTGSDDNTAIVWDTKTGRRLQSVKAKDAIQTVAFQRDARRFVTVTWQGEITQWSTSDGTVVNRLAGHASPGYWSGLTDEGMRIVTGGRDDAVHLWHIESGQKILSLTHDSVRSTAVSRNGRLIAVGTWEDGTTVYDALSGKKLQTFSNRR